MQGRIPGIDAEKIQVNLRADAFRDSSKSYAEVVVIDIPDQYGKGVEKFLFEFQSDVNQRSRMEKAYVGKVCIPGSTYNVQTHLEM